MTDEVEFSWKVEGIDPQWNDQYRLHTAKFKCSITLDNHTTEMRGQHDIDSTNPNELQEAIRRAVMKHVEQLLSYKKASEIARVVVGIKHDDHYIPGWRSR